jgi:adenosine deaminase/adenosine deaminase CECR1
LKRTLCSLAIATLCATTAQAKGPINANEAATARHYAALIAGDPKLAGLTLFFTQMPKGGDLHHHYSGALYAEQYLDFLQQQGYCVDKATLDIVTTKEDAAKVTCLNKAQLIADDVTYRNLLQRWSAKDFYNHGALQAPPDSHFFRTFLAFNAAAKTNYRAGLQTLKERAIKENVGYLETMFIQPGAILDDGFDARLAAPGADIDAELAAQWAKLEQDPAFRTNVEQFLAQVNEAHQGMDSPDFTLRFQTYVLRLLKPSLVFSAMAAAFKADSSNEAMVGVNIVGQESNANSMRDYALHMRMFKFLRTKYPQVKLALHAGELALGDVPPEGLQFHIQEALEVAGASRIGHGLDLAHERESIKVMDYMRRHDIPVEINLTSNAFINGVEGVNHPLTLYRQYGVPYVISTDDAGVTRHTLTHEYVRFASTYKPSYAEVKKASYAGIRYGFLPEADKRRLTTQLDQRYAAFEKAIAGLRPATH